jgi:hypothetical protein
MGQCLSTTAFPFVTAEMLIWVAMNYGETLGWFVSSQSSVAISGDYNARRTGGYYETHIWERPMLQRSLDYVPTLTRFTVTEALQISSFVIGCASS